MYFLSLIENTVLIRLTINLPKNIFLNQCHIQQEKLSASSWKIEKKKVVRHTQTRKKNVITLGNNNNNSQTTKKKRTHTLIVIIKGNTHTHVYIERKKKKRLTKKTTKKGAVVFLRFCTLKKFKVKGCINSNIDNV
jgi:hypothetical protein